MGAAPAGVGGGGGAENGEGGGQTPDAGGTEGAEPRTSSVHQMRCDIAGPCLPCSDDEKVKDPVSCGKTGSRQRLECRDAAASGSGGAAGAILDTGGGGANENFQSCYPRRNTPGSSYPGRGMPLHVFEFIVLLVLSVSLLTVFGKKTGRI